MSSSKQLKYLSHQARKLLCYRPYYSTRSNLPRVCNTINKALQIIWLVVQWIQLETWKKFIFQRNFFSVLILFKFPNMVLPMYKIFLKCEDSHEGISEFYGMATFVEPQFVWERGLGPKFPSMWRAKLPWRITVYSTDDKKT